MKRTLMILLSAVLALGRFGALVGCGDKKKPNEPTDEQIIAT